MSDKKPHVAQAAPYGVELEPGTYWWCACGQSQKQPFCDGSHKKEGGFIPTKVEIAEKKTYWMCGCKHSGYGALCDGTHKKL